MFAGRAFLCERRGGVRGLNNIGKLSVINENAVHQFKLPPTPQGVIELTLNIRSQDTKHRRLSGETFTQSLANLRR